MTVKPTVPKTAQEFCDILDREAWSNRRASILLGLDQKTVAKYVSADSDVPLPLTIGLAVAAVLAGLS